MDEKLDIKPLSEPFVTLILGLVMINPLNLGIYCAFLLIPVFFVYYRSDLHLIDTASILIFLFSVFYCIILLFTGFSFADLSISTSIFLGYLLLPATFYLYGKLIITKYPTINTIYYLLFFICTLLSVIPFLSNAKFALENGFMTQRNIPLIGFPKDQVSAATGIGSYFALSLSLLPLVFIRHKTSIERNLSVIAILLIGAGLFSILNMSDRTGLFILALSLFMYILLPKKDYLSLLFLLVFVIVVYIIYAFNILNFRSWFEYSAYFERLSSTGLNEEGSRFVIWKTNFTNLLSHPYGFFRPDINDDFAHNLWLEVGKRTGYVPLFFLLCFTFISILSIIRVIFSKSIPLSARTLISGFMVGFYVTFFLEPVLEGLFILFLVFCLYNGVVQGLRNSLINEGN